MKTLSRPLLRSHRFVRQTGVGHFALIVCAIEPAPTQVLVQRKLEQVPVEFTMAAMEGLKSGLEALPCQVQLLDGLHHEVDSRVRDFHRAGSMLAREILAETRGPFPSSARSADDVRDDWENRWRDFQKRVQGELEARLSSGGFELTQEGFERKREGIHQILLLKGNSPILPSAVDLRIQLKSATSGRQFGQLCLSRHLATQGASEQPALWRLENEASVSELLTSLDLAWLESASTPQWLLTHRPAGIYWWSALVESRLLALNGQYSEARARAETALKNLQDKLGRAAEIRELEALLEELS